MSCITQVLERGKLVPSDLDRVLLVGGGSKPPAVPQSLRTALFGLMGSDAASKVVIPESALQGELTVIGASTMLPSFEYSPELGLQRIS
jgi:molecular chaperone DnaK (HSP70)